MPVVACWAFVGFLSAFSFFAVSVGVFFGFCSVEVCGFVAHVFAFPAFLVYPSGYEDSAEGWSAAATVGAG